MRRIEKPLINYAQLLRIVGLLLLFEALFLLCPTLTCVCYGESDWLPFAATTALTALLGSMLLTRIRPVTGHMGKRDGFLLTASVWVIFSIFGMIPFLTCSTPLSFSDAFFEAMSGFTTTGASAIPANTPVSHGIMIWQALMQWIGGMGIILFTLAVVPMLNHSGGMQMFNAEVTGITHDKIRPRISQTAKSLWLVYLLLTAALVGLLYLGPMNLFDSVCHAFGTVSTGGFSTESLAIATYHSVYTKIVLIVFMFLGGVNFGLIFKTVSGNFKALRRNDVLKAYIGAIIVFTLLFIAAIAIRGVAADWEDLTVDPLFQVVSTITSTGFYTPECSLWGPFVIAMMLVMMFSGGCAGSTAGGAKVDRVLFLFKNCRNEVYRCIHPNSVMSVRINSHVINSELVNKVIAFLCIYILIVVAGGLALTALDVPLVDAFFSSFSCISNTGFSASVTGYGTSFVTLPDAAKWILSFVMLIGRLEIFTVLVLFSPTFWRK